MRPTEVKEADKWNRFVQANTLDGGLLQSWEWGEFKKSLGHKIFRLSMGGRELEVAALLIKHTLPFGKSYFYCPRGPITKIQNPNSKFQIMELLLNNMKKIAAREGVMFLRVEPAWQEESGEILEKLGFVKTKDVQPRQTLILGLDKSEDELLQEMHPKTRYNIRLAKRRGVTIKITDDWDYFEIFHQLLNQTAHRQRIKLHPKGYYQKMLEVLSKENTARLFLAGFHGKIIAANLVLFFGRYAFYLHGGADHHYRDVMAPYLLQWCAIQEAKKRGCHFYDFWGVTKEKDHPFAGITRFKQGFAPKTPMTEYVGARDLVYQPGRYGIYKIVKKFVSSCTNLVKRVSL